MSVPPPGGWGTMMVTGRVGNSSAEGEVEAKPRVTSATTSAEPRHRLSIVLPLLSFFVARRTSCGLIISASIAEETLL
jgi:hypothetical protein